MLTVVNRLNHSLSVVFTRFSGLLPANALVSTGRSRLVGQPEVIVVAKMGRFSVDHVSLDLRSFLGIAKRRQSTQLWG